MSKPPNRKLAGPQHSGKPGGARAKQPAARSGGSSSKSVVPRQSGHAVPASLHNGIQMIKQPDGTLAPHGYTARVVQPAKNYDVVSFARAMNDDFAPRLKKLFDPETEAAVEAQRTGVYIGWRCPDFQHDCQRVGRMSKCFCGHLLGEHGKYSGHSFHVPCKQLGCTCKAFAWIPSRVEDIGEFWHQRRRDFDPTAWRAKCRCKHTHEEHDPNGMRMCRSRGCGCAVFDSNFLCAACNRHWEDHQTFFETEEMRIKDGLPYGEQYLPFAEIPELRNIALTGEEADDTRYQALTQGEGAIPRHTRPTGNDAPVNFGQSRQVGASKSGFKPIYD